MLIDHYFYFNGSLCSNSFSSFWKRCEAYVLFIYVKFSDFWTSPYSVQEKVRKVTLSYCFLFASEARKPQIHTKSSNHIQTLFSSEKSKFFPLIQKKKSFTTQKVCFPSFLSYSVFSLHEWLRGIWGHSFKQVVKDLLSAILAFNTKN